MMLTLLWAGAASAQDEDARGPASEAPSPEDDARARELFLEADEHYKGGRYAQALAALDKAYALSRREALRFNMANALEKLGRDEEALMHLTAFAPHAPESRRQEVADRIAALRDRIEAREPAPVPLPPPVEPEPAPSTTARPPPRPAPAPLPPPETRPVRDDSPSTTAIAGYALLGAGGLGLGLGAIFGGLALSARSDAKASCTDSGGVTRCLADASDDLDRDRRLSLAADISLGIGLASAVTGGVLVIYALSTDGTTPDAGAASPALESLAVEVDSGGLRVVGSF